MNKYILSLDQGTTACRSVISQIRMPVAGKQKCIMSSPHQCNHAYFLQYPSELCMMETIKKDV
jgi:glycerol kinase